MKQNFSSSLYALRHKASQIPPSMKNPAVARIINDDQWTLVEGESEGTPVIVRFREPLLTVSNKSGYGELLTILWPYAEEDSGALPNPEDSEAMEEFEERLFTALEHDAHAIIAAVITTDGARQWFVYTDDIEECGERIFNMPQNEEPYPIDMETDEDPQWKVLHQILAS